MTTEAVLDAINEDLSPYIGDITDDHVATFFRDGVVHVPGFVKPELCEEVIARFAASSGVKWRDWPSDPAEQQAFRDAITQSSQPGRKFGIRQRDPWMFNYVTQRKFGEAAARLLNVPSIKILSESLQVKHPAGSGDTTIFPWHQDFPSLPIDRAEAMQFWLALVPVSLEMGPMTHLLGSHREPPGGMLAVCKEDAEALYPDMFERYQITPPRPHNAGDAVFHHALTYHASGRNLTDKVRWAMSSYRVSTRCRYTGQHNFNTNDLGLVPNEHFDHPNFPTVYP